MFIKSIGLAFVGAMLFVASAAAANSVLEGVVKDAKGHPIQGVDVRIESKNGGGLLTTAKTDENGRYILKGVAAGTYRVTLVLNGALKTSINNTTLEPGEATQLNFDLTQTRASVTLRKGIKGFGYRRLQEVVCQAAGLKLMTAGPGQRKLAPTTLYGLVAKNFIGQFTAWTSRGGNSSAGTLPVTKHGLFTLSPRYEDTEQDRSRGRSDRVYRQV